MDASLAFSQGVRVAYNSLTFIPVLDRTPYQRAYVTTYRRLARQNRSIIPTASEQRTTVRRQTITDIVRPLLSTPEGTPTMSLTNRQTALLAAALYGEALHGVLADANALLEFLESDSTASDTATTPATSAPTEGPAVARTGAAIIEILRRARERYGSEVDALIDRAQALRDVPLERAKVTAIAALERDYGSRYPTEVRTLIAQIREA